MNKVDEYIAALPEWQRRNLDIFRTMLHDIEPTITEDFKWNTPVYLLDGKMLFATGTFKAHTKYNFLINGPVLKDPSGLINNGLESKNSRAIDLKENESIDADELRALIVQSIQLMK